MTLIDLMKKLALILASAFLFQHSFAQDIPAPPPMDAPRTGVPPLMMKKRAADHFMFQLSSDHWANMPDSISSHQEGLSRGFNAYFMFDKQFKSSPKLSVALGAGVSTSNIFFKEMEVDLKAGGSLLPFRAVNNVDHFKKYKVTTTYLEVPLEFRYMNKPSTPNKGWKAAVGFKAGTLLNAHTKGKTLLDKNNNTINTYTQKESSKRFINGTRFAATARVGYGIVSLFGNYQLNPILKEGAGSQDMRLYQIGIMISGL